VEITTLGKHINCIYTYKVHSFVCLFFLSFLNILKHYFFSAALQCKNSYNPYTLAGFEPGIFCSVGGRDDHYAAPPGHNLVCILLKVT
jgi:hypothetical protein